MRQRSRAWQSRVWNRSGGGRRPSMTGASCTPAMQSFGPALISGLRFDEPEIDAARLVHPRRDRHAGACRGTGRGRPGGPAAQAVPAGRDRVARRRRRTWLSRRFAASSPQSPKGASMPSLRGWCERRGSSGSAISSRPSMPASPRSTILPPRSGSNTRTGPAGRRWQRSPPRTRSSRWCRGLASSARRRRPAMTASPSPGCWTRPYGADLDWAYPRRSDTPVRAAPQAGAATVDTLGLHFVRLLGFDGSDGAGAASRNRWARVVTPAGKPWASSPPAA